mmetsp:Transcript_111289/g.310942  ORF Transcript_111289/g.310942 Transcript_111289/m.310942 type:complete len:329 (+) Transcript_111289:217-1203(+)
MAAARGRLAVLLLFRVGAASWVPAARASSFTPSVRFEYRYSPMVPECDNRCGAGNGTAIPMCSQFRTDLELNGKQVFVRYLANHQACRSRGKPESPKMTQCWGTQPVSRFCTRCGESRCDACAPGFRLVDSACVNDERQVLVDITAPGHLYHEWQHQYQPTIQGCLGKRLREFGIAGADYTEPSISVINVVELDGVRRHRDNILIRCVVRVPLGISASALASWLRLEAPLASGGEDPCPMLAKLEEVSILCPGATPANADGTCPPPPEAFRPPLMYWDCVGGGAIALAALVFACLERRRRARDLAFADSATKQARGIASRVEMKTRDF